MLQYLKILKKLLTVYREVPFYFKFHLIVRYILCPFLELEAIIPKKANIVELGCGSGIFTNLMSIKSSERDITGIDLDEEKISIAKKTVKNRYGY